MENLEYMLSPYRSGYGFESVSVVFTVTGQDHHGRAIYSGHVTSQESDDSEVMRFEFTQYRPAFSVDGNLPRMVDDVLDFARAYADRPDEFEREETDIEQIHRDWWNKHGEALACEIMAILEESENNSPDSAAYQS